MNGMKLIYFFLFQRITAYLSMAVFSAIMGSLQYGYNTGVINAPEKVFSLTIFRYM